jgi:quercetin dioxygenase-like cupin family protein
MIVSNEDNIVIDRTDSMYPCTLYKITNNTFDIPKNSTVYGFVIDGTVTISETKTLIKHEFFSFNSHYESKKIIIRGSVGIIIKYGFNGQNVFGGPVESQGRLCYINNCSDSLLVYPPRMGDASMSLLHFPPGIIQDFHTHPSFRLGIVFRGSGYAECKTGKQKLESGCVFCMEEQEIHRFVTEDNQLSVISFHPDGDWGPTDHDHTLLNRTYLK